MTEQIPDAPWIREAERDGMPPFGDDPDYSEVIALLKQADKNIDDIVETLIEVDDRLTAKIARKLESKGFSKGDIFRVLDRIRRESRADAGEAE